MKRGHDIGASPAVRSRSLVFQKSTTFGSKSREKPDLEILKELTYLDSEFTCSKLPIYAWEYIKLIFPSLVLSADFILDSILNSVGYYLCNQMAQESVEASFGLSLFVVLFFVVGISIAITEKTALSCSLAYGNNDFVNTERRLMQGLFTNLFAMIFFFVTLYLNTETILAYFGFEEGIPELCQHYFRQFFWIYSMYCLIYLVKSFTAAQGKEESIAILTIFNLIIAGLLVYYYCFYSDLGLEGWFWANLLYKGVELVTYSLLCYFRSDPRVIGHVGFSTIFKGYKKFLKDTLIFIVGSYAEQVSFEISTFLVGLTRRSHQIAAQTAFVNIAYYFYEIGLGFAITGRTRMAQLLTHNKKYQAKRFFYLVVVGMMATSALLGVGLYFLIPLLSTIYSSNHERVDHFFRRLILIYCFFNVTEFILSFMYMVARCFGWFNFLAWLNIIFLVVLQMLFGLVIVLYLEMSCLAVMLNVYILEALMLIVVYRRIFNLDWSNAELAEENEDEEAEIIESESSKYVEILENHEMIPVDENSTSKTSTSKIDTKKNLVVFPS